MKMANADLIHEQVEHNARAMRDFLDHLASSCVLGEVAHWMCVLHVGSVLSNEVLQHVYARMGLWATIVVFLALVPMQGVSVEIMDTVS
jgi:hypothetical protein